MEFDHPVDTRRCRSELLLISVVGLAFKLQARIDGIETGEVLEEATVHVGDCVLTGDLKVKNAAPLEDGATSVGCLFYPATREVEAKLMTLLAGMDAVQCER